MAAASNASYELAQFQAERESKRQGFAPPRAKATAAKAADVVIRHAPPSKPYGEMTLGEYHQHLANQGMKAGVIA